MGKSQGNLPYWFHAAENVVFANHVRCPPVQTFHYSTGNFRVHVSVTFLINGDERPLLMGCFLKCLEMSPFRWRGFRKCTINRLNHTFIQTGNVFTNSALIPSINLFRLQLHSCKFYLGNFEETFICFMPFVHTQSTSKSKSAYFCLSHMCTAFKSGFIKFRH